MEKGENHAQFFTATILEWKHLLKQDRYKDILIESLRYLVREKRVIIYAFVIMPNHIHLIWHIQPGHNRPAVQRDFLKFTAQQMRFDLLKTDPVMLQEFEVNAKDRRYQFWERNALSVDLYTERIFIQKLDYIHANPVQEHWKLCKYPENYKYSSAGFYHSGTIGWDFLTHFR